MNEVRLQVDWRYDGEVPTRLDLRAPAGRREAPSGRALAGALSAQLTAQFGDAVDARDSQRVLWTVRPPRAALGCWQRQGTCRSEEET
jgi:hypothetical protein